MLIYSEYLSPRLRYVLKFVFGDVLKVSYRLTDQPEELESYNGLRIAYSNERMEGAFHIPVSGLLSETGVKRIDTGTGTLDGRKVLFALPGDGEMQYDVFAGVFYMLSRYEEYLPFTADRHGRFEATGSLASREGFLEIPIVDIWLKDLRQKIIYWFPGQHLGEGKFEFIPTIDVDHPYAVLHHGKLRTLSGNIRAFFRSPREMKWRGSILRGEDKDPFDTFNDIEWLHASHHLKPWIFFLCAPYARYDRSISPTSEIFAGLVRRTAEYAGCGIHPSYRSNARKGQMLREIELFKNITGAKPLASRQHYLRLRFPGTYRELMNAGITEDYSMGFASAAGFRAGTCRPFHFYDLEKEEETELKVSPFQLMDRTLKDYMGLSGEAANLKIRSVVDNVFDVGGTLISIWHNDALSDHGEWKGWREIYIRMLDYIAEKIRK